jgi:hypothetical protein
VLLPGHQDIGVSYSYPACPFSLPPSEWPLALLLKYRHHKKMSFNITVEKEMFAIYFIWQHRSTKLIS